MSKKKDWRPTGNPQFEKVLEVMNNHMILHNNARATRINYVRGVRQMMLSSGRHPDNPKVFSK